MPTVLIAHANDRLRTFFADQLSADSHLIHEGHSRADTREQLAARSHDLLLLGPLQRPADQIELLRDLRAGTIDRRVPTDLPAIALGPDDELGVLRVYEAGADHHLMTTSGYLLVRAVLGALARRAVGPSGRRPSYRCGRLEVDRVARRVTIDGEPVQLSKRELDLLAALAGDPHRVFPKDELLRDVWGYPGTVRTRTLDSHVCRLRAKLAARGEDLIANSWGVGYKLIP